MRIEEDLMSAVRERAAAEHVSINRMINRLLRIGLRTPETPDKPFRQEARDMGVPKVDLTKASAILDAWDVEQFIQLTEKLRKP